MSVCLDYQSVYARRNTIVISVRMQVIAALLLLVALSAKVWVNVKTTHLGYEVAAERQRTIELDMERRELEMQRSVLLRPDTLARLARQRLKLAPLAPTQARRLVYEFSGEE